MTKKEYKAKIQQLKWEIKIKKKEAKLAYKEHLVEYRREGGPY